MMATRRQIDASIRQFVLEFEAGVDHYHIQIADKLFYSVRWWFDKETIFVEMNTEKNAAIVMRYDKELRRKK